MANAKAPTRVTNGSVEKMYAQRHTKQKHKPLPRRKYEVPKSNKTKGDAQAKNLRKLVEEQPMEADEEMEEVAEKVFSDLESNLSKRQQELFSKTIFEKFLSM
ncbi:uncharacterized protein LOC132599957 [Lycium barbarum]|uniref:uncharacterized protein LOC132599957 n=1 Tax=Lycium barbarum TaxID=112863 RepID=UPI00293E3D46|nr:uncharacterized protein LOC132599957 [Lycium barbarum]XP_060169087.1 uncharacterized protein LOC132599957 [Lycium barbarum]